MTAHEPNAAPGAGRLAWHRTPLLFGLGVILFLTNRWFPLVDDEVSIIDRASAPVSQTLGIFLNGAGQHEHPPLYDLFLHVWLLLTGGSLAMLRIPGIVFYLVGIALSLRIARKVAGPESQFWALLLFLFWPYGFHFGRLAAWYSFCFMLVALETLAYLEYAAAATLRNWIALFLCSLALVYANYFGWVLLACLAFDLLVFYRRTAPRDLARIAALCGLLILSYSPIIAAFVRELHTGVRTGHSFLATSLNGVYVVYTSLLSESVAPWFWLLGIPAAAAIALSIVLLLLSAPSFGRRLFAYFLFSLAIMTLIGVAESKRTLMLGTWLIVPLAFALGASELQRLKPALASCLILIFAIGWFGILDRKLYAAPHWIEPWPNVASRAATVIRNDGVVIGNNSTFFAYLTYLVPHDPSQATAGFSGFLPDSVHSPHVYSPEGWLADDTHPVARTTLLIRGLHYGTSEVPTDETEQSLDARCILAGDQHFAPDFGSTLKQRFFPNDNQLPWRVEVRTYACP